MSVTATAMTHTPCNLYLVFHLLCDFGQGILHPRDSSPIGIILLLSDCSSRYITPDLAGYILFSINKERNVQFPQLQVLYGVPICCCTMLRCTESRFSFHHSGNNQKRNTNRCTSGCDHLSRVHSNHPCWHCILSLCLCTKVAENSQALGKCHCRPVL